MLNFSSLRIALLGGDTHAVIKHVEIVIHSYRLLVAVNDLAVVGATGGENRKNNSK
jgi:hypothetical protein